ncbi:hypothetical protein IFR05_005071 [Cadophora sp. M221]|nr:hypothetical protein IFR05_005071 [Cadophora sp. M221]
MCRSTLVHYTCGHSIFNIVYCGVNTNFYTRETHLASTADITTQEYADQIRELFQWNCPHTEGGTDFRTWYSNYDDEVLGDSCAGHNGLCARDPTWGTVWNIGWMADGTGPLQAPYRDMAHWVACMRACLLALQNGADPEIYGRNSPGANNADQWAQQ